MKYLYCVLVFLSHFATAQQMSEKRLSKKELIEQADYYFFREDFNKSLQLYNEILDNYPRNHYVQYHRYIAYQLTYGKESFLDSLKEYESNEGKTDKFYNYWLGRIHHNRYEFETAEKHFRAFLEMDVYKTKEITDESRDRLNAAIKAQKFYLSPNEYEVVNMGEPINSSASDLSPAFFANHDELLFTSARMNPNDPLYDSIINEFTIFHCIKSGDSWGRPTALKNLGTFYDDNAKIEVVNNDGRLFFFDKKDNSLYFSQPEENDRWKTPIEFDGRLKVTEIASHFFINDEETMIYFSRRTSRGDLDLYQTTYNSGTSSWSDPIPVPGDVNTRYDEDSPFLSHDGSTLYYSTNNPKLSIGGYDVVSTAWGASSSSWGNATNLGFPINTVDDEINYSLNEDNISGFLSSNRLHGKGDFDIYFFHKQGKILVQGSVFDKATGRALADVRLDMRPTNNSDERFRSVTNAQGRFEKEVFAEETFRVEISIGEQLAHSELFFSKLDDHNRLIEKDFYITIPEEVKEETNFATLYDKKSESDYESVDMLGSKFRAGKKAMLRNIYFDIESAHLTQDSYEVLEHLYGVLKENESLMVEIGGHTDNTGTLQANMTLSEARANAVRDFLVKQGISGQRLIAKGYGPSQPLASNDDEENGRELNRRIEVRVLN